MSRKPRTKGRPPSSLTGQLPVSSDHSPWWDNIASTLENYGAKVGTILTIEELTQMIPAYPDGRRPRTRTVARRLSCVLDLVERGPNGSKGRGAKYVVLQKHVPYCGNAGDDKIASAEEWLMTAVGKMTADKKRR